MADAKILANVSKMLDTFSNAFEMPVTISAPDTGVLSVLEDTGRAVVVSVEELEVVSSGVTSIVDNDID